MPFTSDELELFKGYYNKAVETAEEAKIVQLTCLMLNLLVKAGEAVVKHVPVKAMAVHGKDRRGAPLLASSIFKKRVQDPWRWILSGALRF